jgi:hypothetical protein
MARGAADAADVYSFAADNAAEAACFKSIFMIVPLVG